MALIAATASAAPSDNEKRAETIEGLVRIVGAQAGIVLYCRQAYTIDDKVADGLLRTVRPALDKHVGHRQAQAAIDEESQRLAKEIADVGAERWCADQRDMSDVSTCGTECGSSRTEDGWFIVAPEERR